MIDYRPRTVEKGNFSSTLLLHTRTPAGQEAFTFLNTYERMFHAEVMTHRWSRNASSSRAVPHAKMVEWTDRDPAMPLYLGVNRSGMQAGGAIEDEEGARALIRRLYRFSKKVTNRLVDKHRVHKEVANRYLEPWGWITSIQTMGRGQLMNELHFRLERGVAQNYQRLAVTRARMVLDSTPMELDYDEWHVPFHDYGSKGIPFGRAKLNRHDLTWSVARCAWVSYNAPHKEGTWELAKKRHDECIAHGHVTPLEHQLRVTKVATHGLVPGYASYRSTIPNECVAEFDLRARVEQYQGRDFLPPTEDSGQ